MQHPFYDFYDFEVIFFLLPQNTIAFLFFLYWRSSFHTFTPSDTPSGSYDVLTLNWRTGVI